MDSYIGQLLDNRYEILECIGVGGMAMVYKARCHRLNRLVAIKILREDLAQDGDFRRRFHDESKAVAMLSHPNIVAVYDVNRSSVSEYIVMELIDGITLKQYIREKDGIINWRESLHFIIQIIKAVGHAHSRGIIHRDIKPHNIMVLRDGSVKVADFGIARLIGGSQSTLTQEALGSVHYISPEQAKGSRIDERSDLYSAGVVLYEMITGRLPFEGDSPVSVAIQHINSIPLTPREINPNVPEALEAITMKAMASNLVNRYRSADEMLESLEEFRKNPSINFDYKMEPSPLDQIDPTAVTQVLPAVTPQPSPPPPPTPPPTPVTPPPQAQQQPPPRAQQQPPQQQAKQNPPPPPPPNNNQQAPPPRKQAPPPPPPMDLQEDYPREYPLQDKKDKKVQKVRRKKGFPWGVFVVILVLMGFIASVFLFLYLTFFPPSSVEVTEPTMSYSIPSLKGQDFTEVYGNTQLLQEFLLILEDTVTNDSPEGTIISQTPAASSSVNDPTTAISVVVSGGPEIIYMIDVINQDYLKAQVELRNMGLTVASPSEEFHESVPYNHIISFSPAVDTPMISGDTVQLVISKGPEEKKVSLPNFVGETLSWSKTRLEYMNLNVKLKEEYSATIPEGQVMDQYPSAGTEMAEGSDVNLQVSLGIDPATIPEDITKTVTVFLPEAPPDVDETMKVQVTMDDRIVYTHEVNPALTTSISFDVEGNGIKTLTIFFDGMPAGTQSVDFDEVLN